MSAGKLCTRAVVFAARPETVRAAAQRMLQHNVGTLVVVDDARRPVGILTDRDIVLRCVAVDLDPATTSVEEIMTAPVRSVAESTATEEALRVMKNVGARRLVVVGERGELAGILSIDDILELLGDEAAAIGALLRKEEPAFFA